MNFLKLCMGGKLSETSKYTDIDGEDSHWSATGISDGTNFLYM